MLSPYKEPPPKDSAGNVEDNNGICEHVSRATRVELASLLIDKIGSSTGLAASLGITEMAVRKWMLRLTHPSNANLHKMIELALELDATRASEILREDLSKHQASFTCMERLKNAFSRSNDGQGSGAKG